MPEKGMTMIKMQYGVCAETVIQDKEKNTFSLINIMDGIVAESTPVFIQKLAFFIRFKREAGDPKNYEINTSLKIDDDELSSHEFGINFDNKMYNNTRIDMAGVVIPKEGQLRFIIKYKNKRLGSCEIMITRRIDKPQVKVAS